MILITGASGFLGGHLTQELCRRGEHVRVLVRRSSALSHLEGLPVETVHGSLEDTESLIGAVRDVRVIYHCAALSSDWGAWEAFYAANVTGVQNLLHVACGCDTLERFLHVSTVDVYGYPCVPCDETHPIKDIGLPYNRSKGLGEKAVWAAHHRHGLPVTVIRPGNIFGPRSKDFVREIARQLQRGAMPVLNGGRACAGLLNVENGVEAMIQCATLPQTVGQAYNLLDGTGETWREYVDTLADGLGVKRTRLNLPFGVAYGFAALSEGVYRLLHLHSRPLLTRHTVYLLGRDQNYPIGKAQRDFEYRPVLSFAESMERTVAWLRGLSDL